MKTTDISIGNKEYKVIIADTNSLRTKGLKGVSNLPKNKGMLFIWDEPQQISMTMEDTVIPLLQVFMDEDKEVIKIANREDINQPDLVTCDNTMYVLEVNPTDEIEEGDVMEIDEEDDSKNLNTPIMKVLAPDGSTQMELQGGERIFSRKNSMQLIKWAKKSYKSKKESQYKHLGKLVFKYLKQQDEREPEYVEAPN